jgi:hypothetical protein
MITKAINGRTYYLRETFPVSAWRRVSAYADTVEGDDAQRDARIDATLWEMLVDANGEKFPTLDAALDNVDIRDVADLTAAIYGDDDPLAKTTDSATV